MFVAATIHGREIADAVVLPRAALREDDRVWVAHGDGTLRERPVTVVRIDRDRVVIADGLRPGERVCLSAVEGFVDGMAVRTAGAA
jgi:multidrug efflux pump subunit AcrA (membrane-fusion protein)